MALSQLLRYGGKRKRQYFPEDIAGVSALTRGQASDDLDLLLGFDDAPKPSVQPRSVARGLSKRARLVAKIHAELRETEDNGKKQRDLRTSLDALRNEHARLKAEMEILEKQRGAVESEHAEAKEGFEEVKAKLQAAVDAANSTKLQQDSALAPLKDELAPDAAASDKACLLSALEHKYRLLEVEFEDRGRRLDAANELFERSASTATPQHQLAVRVADWTRIEKANVEITRIQRVNLELEGKLAQVTADSVILAKAVEEKNVCLKPLQEEKATLESEITELKALLEEKAKKELTMENELKKSLRANEDLMNQVQFKTELLEAVANREDCSEQRAEFAERSYEDAFTKMSYYKAGNQALQDKSTVLASKFDELEEALKTTRARVDTLEEEYVTLKANNVKLSTQRTEDITAIDNLDSEVEMLRDELATAQTVAEGLRSNLEVSEAALLMLREAGMDEFK